MAKSCPRCKLMNSDNAIHCDCGYTFKNFVQVNAGECHKCGKQLKHNSYECPECGIIFDNYNNLNSIPIVKDEVQEVIQKEPGYTNPTKNGIRNCPYCAEEIKAEAIKCKHCGEWFGESERNHQKVQESPSVSTEVTKVSCEKNIEAGAKKTKLFSWRSFVTVFLKIAIAFLIASFLNIILSAAAGVEPRKIITWTALWIYLSIEAWKFWRWKALIPYPLFLIMTVIFRAIFSSSETGGVSWTNIFIVGTLNIGGLIIFCVLLRKTQRHSRNSIPN